MEPSEQAAFVARVLETMENNPDSGASIIYHYDSGNGMRATIPKWNMHPHPALTITPLITHPFNPAKGVVVGVEFELDFEQPANWLILFHDNPEKPTEANVWEYLVGLKESEAHDVATSDNRHLNYGRRGYSLLRCPRLHAPYLSKP